MNNLHEGYKRHGSFFSFRLTQNHCNFENKITYGIDVTPSNSASKDAYDRLSLRWRKVRVVLDRAAGKYSVKLPQHGRWQSNHSYIPQGFDIDFFHHSLFFASLPRARPEPLWKRYVRLVVRQTGSFYTLSIAFVKQTNDAFFEELTFSCPSMLRTVLSVLSFSPLLVSSFCPPIPSLWNVT